MCTISRHRKAHRRLIADLRGFSSIVGAVFAVLVIISLTTTVFIWSISQNNLYNNAVKAKNQLDAEQSSEKINAFNASYVVSGNTVSVSAPIQNLGYLPLQITRIWLRDINVTGLYNVSALLTEYSNITAGAPATIKADISMMNVQPNHNFTSWLVTGRGNVFATSTSLVGPAGSQGPPGPPGPPGSANYNSTWALISQGIGAFSFDFTSFKYYNVTKGSGSNPDTLVYSSGANSYVIPYEGYLAFSFNLTNLYPNGQSIILDSNSTMWSYFPSSPGQANGPSWYVANVNTTTGVISPSYSPIFLSFNQTKEVFFARQGGSKWFSQQANTLGAINLLMYGVFTGGTQYAQNIPFVALYARA